MIQPQRIVLNTFGSFGDLHPYMAIALELQARGHNPVIATMEFYREKILNAGLDFAPVRPDFPGPKEQNVELLNRIMDPLTGPKYLMEQVIFAAVRDGYEDLLQATSGADLLITHPAAPAGPLVGYKTGIPWISTVLAPMSFFSSYDPPVPPVWQWVNNLRLLGPGVMKLFHDAMKALYKPEQVMALRRELSIPDYGNPMFEGQHSPILVLALFSDLFAQSQPDWPKQARTTGFCLYEDRSEQAMPAELCQFLDEGSPPLVFTLGSSAVWVAKDFYKQSIGAAQQLGRRAVLLVGDERNRPQTLPADMIAVDYAPYDLLFSRACAVVHHGGVGTTSHGLVAGVPTLIVPFAFDQSDNAEHARRLGTSRTLYRKKYNLTSAARELNLLLTDEAYTQNARSVSEKLREEHGARRATDLIEQVLLTRKKPIEEPAYALSN
ncbi:MAG TPA: nucleotide disphospho-sugar-binding domain-containing protein [Pyrinomonadaceae bacterium]|jgi:UDP:flavonoid glycosyltransferase YjiC (YdhE family)